MRGKTRSSGGPGNLRVLLAPARQPFASARANFNLFQPHFIYLLNTKLYIIFMIRGSHRSKASWRSSYSPILLIQLEANTVTDGSASDSRHWKYLKVIRSIRVEVTFFGRFYCAHLYMARPIVFECMFFWDLHGNYDIFYHSPRSTPTTSCSREPLLLS